MRQLSCGVFSVPGSPSAVADLPAVTGKDQIVQILPGLGLLRLRNLNDSIIFHIISLLFCVKAGDGPPSGRRTDQYMFVSMEYVHESMHLTKNFFHGLLRRFFTVKG